MFSGNTAANGGAINNTASTVVQVTGASFIDNTATGDGGAMYVFTALGDQITDCRFLGNTAAGSGGAYWEWSNGTAIGGSTFGGNKATTGGALYLDDQGSLITATAVYGNGASGDGGGIYDGDGVYIKYTGDTISGNHASGDGGGINSHGAGVVFAGAILFHRHAGGFRNSTDSAHEYPSVSFTDNTISGNSAGGRGGGVYNQGSLDASRTRIIGNRAPGGGGGIYDDGAEATVTLTDSLLAGNEPDNCEPLNSITGCTG